MPTEKRQNELSVLESCLETALKRRGTGHTGDVDHWQRMINNWHFKQLAIDKGVCPQWVWVFSAYEISKEVH